jgi:hypothetical protein
VSWGNWSIGGGHRGTQGYQKHTAFDTGNGEARASWYINDSMALQGNVGFAFTNALFPGSLGLSKEQFEDDPTQNYEGVPDMPMPSGSADNGSNEVVEKPYKHHFYIYTQIIYNLYLVFVTRKPE